MSAVADTASSASVTVFVCQSCGLVENAPSAGEQLLEALADRNSDEELIAIKGVECLAVCERPVTLSFAAPGKWTYVIGDVAPTTNVDDILAVAKVVATSPYGVPNMADRPPFFRDGVVSRTPPPDWSGAS